MTITPLFFERDKVPDAVWAGEHFRFFYTIKMFEQTVESELEDSSGEYETAAERNSRDRRAGAVCDVIVTSHHRNVNF